MASLIEQLKPFTKVRSVLNRAVKTWGPRHMFDNDEETCWNSDQGSPQWIMLSFSEPVTVDELHIKFQGGFVGKDCHLEVCNGTEEEAVTAKNFHKTEDFFPEDINSLQIFQLKEKHSGTKWRLCFNESTDFFGRITIYKLDVIGTKAESS